MGVWANKNNQNEQSSSLDEDDRYPEYLKTYRGNPQLFIRRELEVKISSQQEKIGDLLKPDGAKVSVSSGHGTGKDYYIACYIIYFIVCHPQSLVLLTANNIDQVQKILFKYIRRQWKKFSKKRKWITDYFDLSATMLREKTYKDDWSVFSKTSSKGNEEALAGHHAPEMLVVVDEASGVGDKAFETLWGILTEANNKMVLLSQFTRPTGHFAESQTTLARNKGNPDGVYDTLTLNSEDSPFVTAKAIATFIKRFGGRDSPEYGIRIRGVCPDDAEGMLISRSMALASFKMRIEHDDEYGYVGCVDVATDGLRDKSEVTIAKVSGYGDLRKVEVIRRWTAPKGVNGLQLAIELKHLGASFKNITWAIDADGYGKATCQEAERLELNVHRVHWGKPVHSKEKRDQYFDQRAYSSVMVRDAINDARISLVANSKKDKEKTVDQFSKIPYEFTSGVARWKIKTKKEMRSLGIKSPDIFDTHCFFWLVEHIPAGDDYDDTDSDEHREIEKEIEEMEGLESLG